MQTEQSWLSQWGLTLWQVQLTPTTVLACPLSEAQHAVLQAGRELPVFQMQPCLHWGLGTQDSLSSCMVQLWQVRANCCQLYIVEVLLTFSVEMLPPWPARLLLAPEEDGQACCVLLACCQQKEWSKVLSAPQRQQSGVTNNDERFMPGLLFSRQGRPTVLRTLAWPAVGEKGGQQCQVLPAWPAASTRWCARCALWRAACISAHPYFDCCHMLPAKQTTAPFALSADDVVLLVGPSVLPAKQMTAVLACICRQQCLPATQMTAVLALSAEDVAPPNPPGRCTPPGCSLWTLWHPHRQHQQAPLSEAQISRLRQQSRLASLHLPHTEADLAALQQVWATGLLSLEY